MPEISFKITLRWKWVKNAAEPGWPWWITKARWRGREIIVRCSTHFGTFGIFHNDVWKEQCPPSAPCCSPSPPNMFIIQRLPGGRGPGWREAVAVLAFFFFFCGPCSSWRLTWPGEASAAFRPAVSPVANTGPPWWQRPWQLRWWELWALMSCECSQYAAKSR